MISKGIFEFEKEYFGRKNKNTKMRGFLRE